MKERITPCLWYNGNAREASDLYCSVFKHARITNQSSIVTEIDVAGQHFTLLDGGPRYQPNPSISFYYICEDREELDRIWSAFSEKGQILMALGEYPWGELYGWIADPYGVTWQLALGKVSDVGQKITPCLMFTQEQYGRAEEALNHYLSVFKNGKVDGVLRFGPDESPDTEGKIKHAQFAFEGQKFMIMESAHNHQFTFSEGISLTIHCKTQDEIDYYWERLTEYGAESMCGWLEDRFGVSWQVVPDMLQEIMKDPAKAQKAAQAFINMRKLVIEQIVNSTL